MISTFFTFVKGLCRGTISLYLDMWSNRMWVIYRFSNNWQRDAGVCLLLQAKTRKCCYGDIVRIITFTAIPFDPHWIPLFQRKYRHVCSCLVWRRPIWQCSYFWHTIMNNIKINCITAVCININGEDVGSLFGSSELSGAGIVSVSGIGYNTREH